MLLACVVLNEFPWKHPRSLEVLQRSISELLRAQLVGVKKPEQQSNESRRKLQDAEPSQKNLLPAVTLLGRVSGAVTHGDPFGATTTMRKEMQIAGAIAEMCAAYLPSRDPCANRIRLVVQPGHGPCFVPFLPAVSMCVPRMFTCRPPPRPPR